jgi:hypothetical protein
VPALLFGRIWAAGPTTWTRVGVDADGRSVQIEDRDIEWVVARGPRWVRVRLQDDEHETVLFADPEAIAAAFPDAALDTEAVLPPAGLAVGLSAAGGLLPVLLYTPASGDPLFGFGLLAAAYVLSTLSWVGLRSR